MTSCTANHFSFHLFSISSLWVSLASERRLSPSPCFSPIKGRSPSSLGSSVHPRSKSQSTLWELTKCLNSRNFNCVSFLDSLFDFLKPCLEAILTLWCGAWDPPSTWVVVINAPLARASMEDHCRHTFARRAVEVNMSVCLLDWKRGWRGVTGSQSLGLASLEQARATSIYHKNRPPQKNVVPIKLYPNWSRWSLE